MKNNTFLDQNQQYKVLLGMASQPKLATTICPDDAQLSAFIDDTLPPSQRKIILAHLHSCDACFDVWQITTSVMNELTPPVISQKITKKSSWWSELSAWLTDWQTPALGVAFSMFLMVLLMPKYFLQNEENPAYSTLKSHQNALQTVLAQQTFLANDTNEHPLGFSPQASESLNHQAFIAGINLGEQRLLDKSPAVDSNLPLTYQQLGEWAVLLWTVCQLPTDVDSDFWRQQQQQGQALLQELRLSDQARVLLTEIQAKLVQLPQAEQPQLYEQLSRQLQQLAMVID